MLIDALSQITGTTEKYSSAIPEPFTFIPGEPALDRAARRQHHQFVPRAVRPSAARHRPGIGAQQPPHRRPAAAPAELQPHPAQDRAEPHAPEPDCSRQGDPREIVNGLYLTILSRFPTEEELKIVDGVFPVRQRERPRGGRWTWPGR